MRKFNTNFACCTNERDYNNLIYGCENRYNSCDIDFKRDIQLDLFKNHMEKYIATDYGMFEKFKYGDYLKDIAQNHFKLILPFLYYEYINTVPNSVSQKIHQNYQDYLKEYITRRAKVFNSTKEKWLLGRETLENWGKTERISIDLREMLDILDCTNNTFMLTKRVIPNDMVSVIKNYIKKMYKYLGLKNNPTFIIDKEHLSEKVENGIQKGLLIKEQAIVIKGVYFDKEKKVADLLHGCLARALLPRTEQPFILDNCCFNIPCNLKTIMLLKCPILFRNCTFKRSFISPIRFINYGIVFDNCVFSDTFELELKSNLEVYFNDCIFEEGSQLKLDWTGSDDCKNTLSITDCVFHGEFELSSKIGIKLIMNNITFYEPFSTSNMKLDANSKISNLCFPTTTTSEMEASKKQLYDSLVESGLKEMAENLNLLSGKTQKKKKEIDLAAYQIAYNTGWLNNIFAAYCLGRTPNYLSKKRMADMKMVTQQSLPFKGTGKDIQYPVEALLAFKAKDWDTLKNLRKKYPIPTK